MDMSGVAAGVGRIVLDAHGEEAVFTELSCAYPLKLLSPRLNQPRVAVAYILNYGGGLVGGDQVDLSVNIDKDAILVLLTQGTTKVFKTRLGRRPLARADSNSSTDLTVTRQHLHVSIPYNGSLFLLPEPVTCFRSAKYQQLQTIHMSSSASLVLLDWYTSGRKSLGEHWVFDRYYSLNEIFVDGRRLVRDATLLEGPSRTPKGLSQRTLAEKMAPYSCYTTVLFYGALTQLTRDQLGAAYEATTVFKQSVRPNLIWSFSPFFGGGGAVLRVAASESEEIRNWLRAALQGLERIVGDDIFKKAMG